MARSIKVSFDGSQASLAAKLDLPAGRARGYALFAHCFSCSKDIFAATRIAQALTRHGIATLRFDFTGLGHSDGEFANTNFSSNVADLLKAADFLRQDYEAPRLLIGHSLGGAAVLMAAGEIAEVAAVATIGAPADVAHVTRHFQDQLETINAEGEAEVALGGRPFRIRKQFVDDLKAHRVTDAAKELRKPLMVFHSPLDETVGIDNATEIFVAAKHPKSFISLDKADHLLSRREDAVFVADVVGGWAESFLPARSEALADTAEKVVRVRESGHSRFASDGAARGHRLVSDQPEAVEGGDLGPTPYEFAAMALGACTNQTLRMYAERKGLKLDRVTTDVIHEKTYTEDCEDCVEGRGRKVSSFRRVIALEGELSEEARARLLEIADKCPVHKMLAERTLILTEAADGTGTRDVTDP